MQSYLNIDIYIYIKVYDIGLEMELRAQTASFESIRMAEHKNMMQMPIAQMSVTGSIPVWVTVLD